MSDADRVQQFLESLSPRELALVTEVAIAGHIEGWKWAGEPGRSKLPHPELIADVIGRCLSQPGAYPTVSAIARGGER